MFKNFLRFLGLCSAMTLLAMQSSAQTSKAPELPLAAGDTIRIQVFQNPDLTLEARLSEKGAINYPLVGQVQFAGLTVSSAEQKLADELRSGGFVKQPQVNIVVFETRGRLASVLGQVTKPGKFPLDVAGLRVTDLIAMAEGVSQTGGDTAIVTGQRDGKPFRRELDVAALFAEQTPDANLMVAPGDTIFVPRAPMFYIYGEAQKPGAYRIERGMTVMQALATGGGPTSRGTERRLRLHRKTLAGTVEERSPSMDEKLQAEDVIYVRESIF